VDIDEKTQQELLKTVAEVEKILPKLKKKIAEGKLTSAYAGVFWAFLLGPSPTGTTFSSVELTNTRRVTFSLVGHFENFEDLKIENRTKTD